MVIARELDEPRSSYPLGHGPLRSPKGRTRQQHLARQGTLGNQGRPKDSVDTAWRHRCDHSPVDPPANSFVEPAFGEAMSVSNISSLDCQHRERRSPAGDWKRSP